MKIVLAGGKISCNQCTAKSKRSGVQCRAPALKTSKAQKCRVHGGKSTGPKTQDGIQRIRKANMTHGNQTKQAKEIRVKALINLAHLQDVMALLDMRVGSKTPGPKPRGYKKIETIEAANDWLKTEK